MKKILIHLCLTLCIYSCDSSKQVDEDTDGGLSNRGKAANMAKAKTYNLVQVGLGTSLTDLSLSDRHLYGNFFEERASFYIIEQPELFLSDAEVLRLTLYFIDGVLCKKKFLLNKDISTSLIRSYGGFKFLPLNMQSKTASKKNKIIIKTENGHQLNGDINKYQLKWDKNDTAIKYRFKNDSVELIVTLEEELTAYRQLLKMAEKKLPL